jgi:hypothetical protein
MIFLALIYLSKFKTLRILCKDYQIDLKDDRCIYVIIAKIGSAYFIFVSTFYATEEALGSVYKEPTLEYFFDYLIREKDKILQLGVINTIGTSNKELVTQHKNKS